MGYQNIVSACNSVDESENVGDPSEQAKKQHLSLGRIDMRLEQDEEEQVCREHY